MVDVQSLIAICSRNSHWVRILTTLRGECTFERMVVMTIPSNPADLFEVLSGKIPSCIRNRPDYLSMLEFYRKLPPHFKECVYGVEVHLDRARIDGGYGYMISHAPDERIFNLVREVGAQTSDVSDLSWVRSMSVAENFDRMNSGVKNGINIFWYCYDAESMKKGGGPVIYYFNTFPKDHQEMNEINEDCFLMTVEEMCRVLFGQDFRRDLVDGLVRLRKVLLESQCISNIGVSYRKNPPCLKTFISGKFQENLDLCKQFKKNPDTHIFLEKVAEMKKFYGNHTESGLDIDFDGELLVKADFDLFVHHDDRERAAFIDKLIEWPFFKEQVSDEDAQAFRNLFNAYTQHAEKGGMTASMHPTHIKVTHRGNGVPHWKFYLNFWSGEFVKGEQKA